MQAASTEEGPGPIEDLILDALNIVHSGDAMMIGAPEATFGWTFYSVSIARSAISRLASLPESEIIRVRGDSLEQKFVNWLNRQAKKKGMDERIHFSLASDMRSSRYGLF
jgi:hypothetical protein